MKGINRLLFSINEGSSRMFVSDQITKESQYLETRNIMDRVKRIAPFFQYDTDPYIFIREDGSLAWIIDAYLRSEERRVGRECVMSGGRWEEMEEQVGFGAMTV